MKKYLVVLLVVLLSAACLGVLGCGGNEGTAKEYMKTADEAFAALEIKLEEMGTLSDALIGSAVAGNLTAITPDKIAAVQALVAEVPPMIEAVEAEYQKLADLTDVPTVYTDYAVAMVDALKAQSASIEAGGQLLAALLPVLQSGDQAQIAAAIQSNMAAITKVQTLSADTDKAFADAQAIKTDNNLGE